LRYTFIIQLKETFILPNIKPISDLTNYSEVLLSVNIGQPLFLTKNGRECYAVLDIRDYEEMQATIKLMAELSKGEQSALEKGWRTADEVEAAILSEE
jgi:prevent-host-death family protein